MTTRTPIRRFAGVVAALAVIGLSGTALHAALPTASADIISFNQGLRVSGDVHHAGGTYTLTALVVQPGYTGTFYYQLPGGTRQLIGSGTGSGSYGSAVASVSWTPAAAGTYTISATMRGGNYFSDVAQVNVTVLAS